MRLDESPGRYCTHLFWELGQCVPCRTILMELYQCSATPLLGFAECLKQLVEISTRRPVSRRAREISRYPGSDVSAAHECTPRPKTLDDIGGARGFPHTEDIFPEPIHFTHRWTFRGALFWTLQNVQRRSGLKPKSKTFPIPILFEEGNAFGEQRKPLLQLLQST